MNKKLVLGALFILAIFMSATFINISSVVSADDSAPQPSTTIVISQVYGGGGNAGAVYQFDYVELFNRSSTPQSLNGLAIQYGSSTGDFGGSTGTNVFALPNMTLQPGQRFLIQLATSGAVGAVLPVTADASASGINLSGASGKVALTNTTTPLGCGGTTVCAANDSRIIDIVAYGASNNGEGGTTAGGGTALTSTQGIVRNGNGCTDTDNNNNDFTVTTNPVPRNMASAATPCGSGPQPTPTPRALLDFTGDGRSDWATLASTQTVGAPIRWKVSGNPAPSTPNAAFIRHFDYGFNTDDIVAADYIGDRKTEPTVWRPGTPGIFYVANFPSGVGGVMIDRSIRFGASTDTPVEGGDYDADGKADYTVVRINGDNTLTWFIKSSATGAERAIPFGTVAGISIYQFFPGTDFNGDGKDEIVFATVNPTNGFITYFAGDSNTGVGVITRQFGDYDNDYSVAPADYTGDRRADFVAVRQTTSLGQQTWYINNSATNVTTATGFGIPDNSTSRGDIQVRGDYDGDGIQDICVYRPSNTTFYYLRSSSNRTVVDGQKHGDPGDVPLGSLANLE